MIATKMRRPIFPLLLFSYSRRAVIAAVCGAAVFGSHSHAQTSQDPQTPDDQKVRLPENNEDPRLPDGKSQKNAIAKQQHEEALKDADRLLAAAEDLRNQLREAGSFVVPLGSVKKTEEIEKLARRIRGRLKF
jgi:hypothetical protein